MAFRWADCDHLTVTMQWDAVSDLLDYPMFIATTSSHGDRAGCLVGFATQASINPPRFIVGLSDKNFTYRVAERAERLAVHVLSDEQRPLAELFGETTGDDTDKFTRCAWHEGPDGVPVLTEAIAWFSGPILSRHRVGDHVVFLLELDAAEVRRTNESLLTFAAVRDLQPGHDA